VHTYAQKPKAIQRTTPASSTMPSRAHLGQSRDVNLLPHWQRTIGNQAVQRLLQNNADDLKVGSAKRAPRFAHHFSRIPVYAEAPGHINGQQADSVSEQVMGMPEPQLQRACACGGSCPKCQTEQRGHGHERLQTKRALLCDWEQTAVPPIVHDVLGSPGQPLDRETRVFMEPRFGHDFSSVRLHTDTQAAESARAVNARAYAVGHDVVFAAGQYAPKNAAGRHLLAHELAHTIQQSGTSTTLAPVSLISRPNDAAEMEADTAADAVSGGSSFAVTDHLQQIAREEEPTMQVSADQPTPKQSPADQLQDKPEGQYACVIKEQIPIITTPVAVFDDVVLMQTDVDIEWQPPASKLEPIHAITYCDCACGEYRQFVKGHMIRNGAKVELPLAWGAKLEETVWHEDGDPAAGLVPGHRDRQESKNDIFDRPNREWGCHYHGKDEPRLPGKRGDMIDVDIAFKGQTYDKCQNKFGQIHEWAFTYKGPLGGL